MILWCAYCQQFQGERPPYDQYKSTHGICPECEIKNLEYTVDEFEQIKKLKKTQETLLRAGLTQDLQLAEEGIRLALQNGSRPVDVIMGVLTPLLWEIGDLWRVGMITVADEHRFTTFYESIISDIVQRDKGPWIGADGGGGGILLMNAPGNRHYLGLRVLQYWLHSKGIHAETLTKPVSIEKAIVYIEEKRPRVMGFSIALAEQLSAVIRIMGQIRERFSTGCPFFMIGGNAVKQGMIEKVDGANLVFDLKDVSEFLMSAKRS